MCNLARTKTIVRKLFNLWPWMELCEILLIHTDNTHWADVQIKGCGIFLNSMGFFSLALSIIFVKSNLWTLHFLKWIDFDEFIQHKVIHSVVIQSSEFVLTKYEINCVPTFFSYFRLPEWLFLSSFFTHYIRICILTMCKYRCTHLQYPIDGQR